MFQQFQATQITPSSSSATFAQSGNPTVGFTSRTPDTSIIDTGESDHITGNKVILHSLSSPLSLPTVTLANDIASRIESVSTAKVTISLPS